MNEERTTLEKLVAAGACGRPDAQLRRHSQCAERRHGHQRTAPSGT